jgi:hypothetical protein
VIHLHQLEGIVGERGGVRLSAALGTEGDVVADGQVREERVGLEDRVDRTLVGTRPGEVGVADEEAPARRLFEPGHHAQGRRLAAAGRAEQGEERAPRDDQAEVVDGGEVGEGLGDVLQTQVALASRKPLAFLRAISCPSPSAQMALYSASSSGVSARNPWMLLSAMNSSLGKMNGLSASSGSIFAISSWAPTTGQT